MPHSAAFVESIRQVELAVIADKFPPRSRILELGAGAGWQAKRLQELGHDVVALEFAHPGFHSLRERTVFPVEDYDGVHIPYPDASFDVVFSSNVLEHVTWEHPLQMEISRVLRPDGLAIHIVPSPAWRIWSWLSHYIFAVKQLIQKLFRIGNTVEISNTDCRSNEQTAQRNQQLTSEAEVRKSWFAKATYYLLPERHGEVGNFLTEAWYFSRWRWLATFQRAGFSVVERSSIGLTYTGYGVLGERLPLDIRQRMGGYLGRATSLYVVKKKAS